MGAWYNRLGSQCESPSPCISKEACPQCLGALGVACRDAVRKLAAGCALMSKACASARLPLPLEEQELHGCLHSSLADCAPSTTVAPSAGLSSCFGEGMPPLYCLLCFKAFAGTKSPSLGPSLSSALITLWQQCSTNRSQQHIPELMVIRC